MQPEEVENKSNEITAVPKLIAALALFRCRSGI